MTVFLMIENAFRLPDEEALPATPSKPKAGPISAPPTENAERNAADQYDESTEVEKSTPPKAPEDKLQDSGGFSPDGKDPPSDSSVKSVVQEIESKKSVCQ